MYLKISSSIQHLSLKKSVASYLLRFLYVLLDEQQKSNDREKLSEIYKSEFMAFRIQKYDEFSLLEV